MPHAEAAALARRQSSSGALGDWLEGDLVAEALELAERMGEGLAAVGEQQVVGPRS